MEHLSKQEISFCDNIGLAGILIGLSCLIQHIILLIPNIVTITMIAVYIFSIVSFFLLTKKSDIAPILVLISAVLIFVQEAMMIYGGAYSLVLLLYLIYVVVIAVLIYTCPLPKKLKLQAAAIKADKENWVREYNG